MRARWKASEATAKESAKERLFDDRGCRIYSEVSICCEYEARAVRRCNAVQTGRGVQGQKRMRVRIRIPEKSMQCLLGEAQRQQYYCSGMQPYSPVPDTLYRNGMCLALASICNCPPDWKLRTRACLKACVRDQTQAPRRAGCTPSLLEGRCRALPALTTDQKTVRRVKVRTCA